MNMSVTTKKSKLSIMFCKINKFFAIFEWQLSVAQYSINNYIQIGSTKITRVLGPTVGTCNNVGCGLLDILVIKYLFVILHKADSNCLWCWK